MTPEELNYLTSEEVAFYEKGWRDGKMSVLNKIGDICAIEIDKAFFRNTGIERVLEEVIRQNNAELKRLEAERDRNPQ